MNQSALTERNIEPTRLVLLGGDLLLRGSLERILALEPDMAVVGSGQTGTDVQALLEQPHLDLVLLDLDGCMEAGFQFLAACHASSCQVKILVLTRGLNPLSTMRALQLRVAGIFLKGRGLDSLLTAIRMVAAGEAWLEPDTIRLLAAGVQGTVIPSEDDVLQGVLDGLTNSEIAARTGLPESVVRSQLHRLFRKAVVRTRGELIRAHWTRSRP